MLFYFIYNAVILLYYYIAVIDALNWIAIFKREIYSLRDRENLLKSQLTIFGINYPDSRELAQLDKVNVARIPSSCTFACLFDFSTLFYLRRM